MLSSLYASALDCFSIFHHFSMVPMLMVVILTVEAPKRRGEGQERKEERETAGEERKGEGSGKWRN